MVSRFLRTGYRIFKRHASWTLLTVCGLALGLFAAMGILLYVVDETSYDTFHANADSIYRINTISRFNGNESRYSTTTPLLADAIRADIPDATSVVRLFNRQAAITLPAVGNAGADRKFREDNFYFADPSAWDVFTFKFLAGSSDEALRNPQQVVLSRRIAEKYFGSVQLAIGQPLVLEEKIPLVVSAVIENYPPQSHLVPDVVAHFENFYAIETEEIQQFLRREWIYNPVATYVVAPPAAVADLQVKVNKASTLYADERVRDNVTYELQPLKKIHLYSNFTYEQDSFRVRYLYILGTIGIVILIIACVNFVNLSTVHSLKRAREIGVRKVLGAERRALMLQFFSESGVLVFVSCVMAFLMLYGALPWINQVSAKQFTGAFLFRMDILAGMAAVFVVTTFLAGLYPSFYISRFKPLTVLKGLLANRTNQGFWLRRALVVLQFTVSIALVVLSVVFYNQMRYVQRKPLGFEKEHMLTIPLFSYNLNSILGGGVDGPLRGRMNAFEEALAKLSFVEGVTLSSNLPGQNAVNALVQTDSIREVDNVFMGFLSVDYDFLETYGMPLVAGRRFSRETGTDHLEAFVVNEAAVPYLGFNDPYDALGKSMELVGKKGKIIGVVKNFHFQGLQELLRPLALEVAAGKFTVFSVRLHRQADLPAAVQGIRRAWDNVFPEKVFEYRFLDEQLQLGYEREQRLLNLMKIFASMAVLISALGLFGLAAFFNHQRQREVSIRKVLGATTRQIFYLLSREFIAMSLVASAVAVPLSYVLARRWLDSFAYKIGIDIVPFLIGGSVAVATVLTAIGYQTLRTARINPAEKLRSE